MKHMTLIGVTHNDPEGKPRLEYALEHLAPDIVTIELPHYIVVADAVDQIRTVITGAGMILGKKLAEAGDDHDDTAVCMQLLNEATCFDWTVSFEYAKAHRIPIYAMDCKRPFQLEEDTDISKLAFPISKINPQLLYETIVAEFDKAYEGGQALTWLMRQPGSPFAMVDDIAIKNGVTRFYKEDLSSRDKETAERISFVHKKGHLVHVCGMMHAFPELYGVCGSTIKHHFQKADRLRLCDVIELIR